MSYPTLKNAPIQEGLIDLRATFGSIPTELTFKAIGSDLIDSYSEGVAIQGAEMQFQFSDTGLFHHAATSYRGLMLTSKDSGFVFQAQIDGFTLSRLRPYSTWNQLFDEAKKLWNVYAKHAEPSSVRSQTH